MEIQKPSYIILTPIKNELPYFKETLESVCKQSILPHRWIILDDGSNDGTSKLIKLYKNKFPFIEYFHLHNFRPNLKSTGARSAALMNYARKLVKDTVDFIIKIDADISFNKDFFERIFNEFKKFPKLGIASGHLVQNGKPEKIHNYNSIRGATRIYKFECFNKLEFQYLGRGEDEMDTYKARYCGYDTRTFDIFFNHLKPEGIRNNILKNHFVTGYFKGKIPYHLVFFCGTLLKNILNKPFIIGSIIQWGGYLYSRYIKKDHPFDKNICEYIIKQQKQHIYRMFQGIEL